MAMPQTITDRLTPTQTKHFVQRLCVDIPEMIQETGGTPEDQAMLEACVRAFSQKTQEGLSRADISSVVARTVALSIKDPALFQKAVPNCREFFTRYFDDAAQTTDHIGHHSNGHEHGRSNKPRGFSVIQARIFADDIVRITSPLKMQHPNGYELIRGLSTDIRKGNITSCVQLKTETEARLKEIDDISFGGAALVRKAVGEAIDAFNNRRDTGHNGQGRHK